MLIILDSDPIANTKNFEIPEFGDHPFGIPAEQLPSRVGILDIALDESTLQGMQESLRQGIDLITGYIPQVFHGDVVLFWQTVRTAVKNEIRLRSGNPILPAA